MFESERAEHDVSVLNGLIETTIDSVDGYRRASDEASASRFADQFRARAREREEIVSRLRTRVRELGGQAEDDGSMLARIHRAFLSLRETLSASDDNAVVAEVDHGESYLDGKWRAALDDNQVTAETRGLLQQCYDSVRRGREEWRSAHAAMSGGSGGSLFESAGGTAGTART